MSAIFNDLRLLEAKRDSGGLSKADFEKQKSALLDDVPEAFEIEYRPINATAKPGSPLWDTLFLWFIAAVLCGAATWALTGNVGMASTLGITVLAAFTIKLFTALD